MAIDPKSIAHITMALMEDLERKYGPDATLDGLVVIAGIDDGDESSVEFRASDGSGRPLAPWKVKGLLATIDEHV